MLFRSDLTIGWNAYSGNGDVTAAVVYANYGTREDFETLRELGIGVKGHIVVARYGHNFRGYKAKFAEAAGAVGLIIYTDPDDSGDRFNLPQEELGAALNALANTLRQVAPVHVLCDPTDIRAHANLRSPFSDKPSIYIYESYPGGVGFSDKLFSHHKRLLEAAISLLDGCDCKIGCPSCIGPALESGSHGKQGALKLARFALTNAAPAAPPTVNEVA